MGKSPKDPGSILPDITSSCTDRFGPDLVSIILYGSATGKDFRPGRSDINLMIALTENGIENLDRAFKMVSGWRRKGVALPLFVTEEYVETSLDVFPIEYLNMKNHYRLIHGKDILKDLRFDREFLRLQCEREIKGKLLLMRGAFIETSGKGRALKDLISKVFPALMAIFEALLYLKGVALPQKRREIVRAVTGAFDLDGAIFEGLLDIRDDNAKFNREKSFNLFKGCLREMRKLSRQVNALGG